MTPQRSLRQINYSHLLLICGMVLSLMIVMFRPSGAEAVLPTSVGVYDNFEADGQPATVKVNDLPQIKNVDYNVIFHGQTKGTKVGLTGVPLAELLKNGGVDTTNMQFVKIRLVPGSDSVVSLVPLGAPDAERPPIVLSSGKKPGFGSFATPAIVPGQPDLNKAISEDSFMPVPRKGTPIEIVPAKAGAKVMGVKISSKKRKNGQYSLSAKVSSNGTSAAKSYQWYGFDSKGVPVSLGTGPSIETKDATDGTSKRQINVTVIERGTGSTGANSFNYTSRKKSKGSTKNPYPAPTQSTGNTSPGTGFGGGTGSGTPGSGIPQGTSPGGITSTIPNTTTTPPPSTNPTSPTTVPDTATPAQPGVDTTAITNAAQNASGTGGLKTVSGVLLSSPTVAPAAAAGGTPVTALPAPVATQLNSIFQPVNDVDDAWVYLLALLFAFTFSGAVREWVKP